MTPLVTNYVLHVGLHHCCTAGTSIFRYTARLVFPEFQLSYLRILLSYCLLRILQLAQYPVCTPTAANNASWKPVVDHMLNGLLSANKLGTATYSVHWRVLPDKMLFFCKHARCERYTSKRKMLLCGAANSRRSTLLSLSALLP